MHTIVHPWTLVPYTLSTRSTHHIHCGLHSAHTPKRLCTSQRQHTPLPPHTCTHAPHSTYAPILLIIPNTSIAQKTAGTLHWRQLYYCASKKMLHNAQCILIPILCIAKYNFLPSVECTMSDPLYKTQRWENLLKSTECWIVHADRAFRPEKAPLYPPWLNQHNVLHSGSWNSS